MNRPYFKRASKAFYVDDKGRAGFRMVADFLGGSERHRAAVVWDFLLSTLVLDGDIPSPEYETDFYRAVIVDADAAFFTLFAVGIFDPDVEVANAEEARIAWATEARAYLMKLEGEKLNEELAEAIASGDYEEPDEEDVREVTFAVQWVRSNHDDRQGLMLAQFPPTDALRDVWVETGEKWIASTVRGSHTIPVHIGIDPSGEAWQRALGTLKKWDAAHGSESFVVHAENDGDFLAIEDVADPRLYTDFDLHPEDDEES